MSSVLGSGVGGSAAPTRSRAAAQRNGTSRTGTHRRTTSGPSQLRHHRTLLQSRQSQRGGDRLARNPRSAAKCPIWAGIATGPSEAGGPTRRNGYRKARCQGLIFELGYVELTPDPGEIIGGHWVGRIVSGGVAARRSGWDWPDNQDDGQGWCRQRGEGVARPELRHWRRRAPEGTRRLAVAVDRAKERVSSPCADEATRGGRLL